MSKFFIPVLFVILCAAVPPHAIPDPELTYGTFCTESDKDFKEFRYKEKVPVCWRNVSYEKKLNVMKRYNFPLSDRAKYEIDHCIPLSLGGSNAYENLWPQPRTPNDNEAKNELALRLYLALKEGAITYKEAIRQMREYCPDRKLD